MEWIRDRYGKGRLIELNNFIHGNYYKNLLLAGGDECAQAMNITLGVELPRMLTHAEVRGLKKTQEIKISVQFARDLDLAMPFTVSADLRVTGIINGTDLDASGFMATGDVILEVDGAPATINNLDHAFTNQDPVPVLLHVRIVRSAEEFNGLSFYDEAGRGCGWVERGQVRAGALESPLD
jgi:hypothetical protein